MIRFHVRLLGLVCLSFLLVSCKAITNQLQHSANLATREAAAVPPSNPDLEGPQMVELDRYHAPPHQKNLAIAVAASGGGYRAANLLIGVLLGLEKIKDGSGHNLLQAVNYYSTVSGGGFGVGYYITQMRNYSLRHPNSLAAFSLNQSVSSMLAQDSLGMIQPNPLRADLSDLLFFGADRGQVLEEKFNKTLLATPRGGLKLGDIFIPIDQPRKAQLPLWVTNSTIYQNAAIFPFTPDVLARYQVINYFHNQTMTAVSGDIQDENYASEVPVAVGLTASASVPVAITPTTLVSTACKGGGECYLQLYDGGLADNLGIYTALSLLLQDNSPIKVLIIVDAYTGEVSPFSDSLSPPENVPLVRRILTTVTDASHENLQTKIYTVGRDLLCQNGARRVLVVRFNLRDFPEAQKVNTNLNLLDLKTQRFLIAVGEKLVQDHPELIKIFTHPESLKNDRC
ncbi:MAG: patatin-like phospholipase family protein [Gammaproteobacteria bacterium]|nr:patatin-like phospholipase family protein [Gammaproteobacteria bacterium]